MPEPPRPLAIRELPVGDRPVSRLIDLGPVALSDAELLAVIGGVRTLEACQLLLARLGGWDGLRRALHPELAAAPGVTAQMAAQIQAACELHRRLTYAHYGARVRVGSPGDAAPLAVAELGHLDQQRLIALILDSRNRLVATHLVYQGEVSPAMVRAGEVFKEAVRRNAAAMIVAPMPRTRIVAASVAHHAAAELCALIERSGVNVDRRCNAVTTGAAELAASVVPEIVGDAWHYPSRSRLGQVRHTVTSTVNAGGRRLLICTCEAGDLDSACWHRGHRALLEHLAARPDGAELLAIDLAAVRPGAGAASGPGPAVEAAAQPATTAPAGAGRERRGRLAARAEADFWARHGPALGGSSLGDVEALLDRPVPRPRSAEGWVSLGEQVERALGDPAVERRLAAIDARLGARRGAAAPNGRLPRRSAQEEVDELYPPKV